MDPSINPETGETTTTGRSPRFSMWVALTVFSVVVLGASVELKGDVEDAGGSPGSEIKWAVACSIITVILGGLMILGHLFPIASTIVVGTRIEGALATALMVAWGCTVAVATNADEGVLDVSGGVTNANLYYFSWFCFVSSVIMFVNYCRSAFGLDLVGEVNTRGARLNLWAAFLATSLVVAGSSGRALSRDCHDGLLRAEFGDEYCTRTKFGVSTGAIGIFLALGIVIAKTCLSVAPHFVELMCAVFAAVLNGLGVAFVTSNKGPGRAIGNLYYFSWASFLLAAFLTAECFGSRQAASAAESDDNKQEDNGDIEVENLESSP